MKICIIINSCLKFYQDTVKAIIPSIINAKIPMHNIYVVVGESLDSTENELHIPIIQREGYFIIFTKYVNVDNNGYIFFSQTDNGQKILSNYDYFFYTHDTTEFLPHFYTTITKCQTNSYIKLQKIGSKSIGLFNTLWFLNNKTELFISLY
jgi:hypothetical protein